MKGCRPLSREEIARAVKAFDGPYAVRNRCLFILGVTAGFRISELLSLRLGDVVRGGLVMQEVAVARSAMKGKHEGRTIFLAIEAREAILAQVKALRCLGWWRMDTYLFKSQGMENRAIGRRVAWKILQDVFGKVGIIGHVGCHAMRKTYANEIYSHMLDCVAKGEPVDPFFETVKALGHADPKSTTAYLAFRQERVRDAIRCIGGLVGNYAHS